MNLTEGYKRRLKQLSGINEELGVADTPQIQSTQQAPVQQTSTKQPGQFQKNTAQIQQGPANLTMNNYNRQLYSLFKKEGASPSLVNSAGQVKSLANGNKGLNVFIYPVGQSEIGFYIANVNNAMEMAKKYVPLILKTFPTLQIKTNPTETKGWNNETISVYVTFIVKTTAKGAPKVTESK